MTERERERGGGGGGEAESKEASGRGRSERGSEQVGNEATRSRRVGGHSRREENAVVGEERVEEREERRTHSTISGS